VQVVAPGRSARLALTEEQDGIRVKRRAAMRKTPTPDADPAKGPDAAAAAGAPPAEARPAEPGDDNTAPSLVWPPAEDELNEWEVLQFKPSGNTIIEPMKFVPPAPPAAKAPPVDPPTDRHTMPPPTPAPYVPPVMDDDPVGDTMLLSPMGTVSDFDLPETELIEPLSADLPMQPVAPAASGSRPAAAAPTPTPYAEPDDRTVVIPRPTFGPKPRTEPIAPPVDDAGAGAAATRILIAPNFAASVGHAPTVPVSAIHRSGARPDSPDSRSASPDPRTEPRLDRSTAVPRSPMEETLPAGVTRDLTGLTRDDDDTSTNVAPAGDTHPVAVSPHPSSPRRVPAGPAGPPSPFSRVHSRGPQPVVPESTPAAPPPVAPAPPLAFGPRVPAAAAPAAPIAFPAPAPVPSPASAAAIDASIPTRPVPTPTRTKVTFMAIAAGLVLLLALGGYQILQMRNTSAAALSPATLSIESSPAGAVVAIDGTPRGKTPLRLELPEGQHALDVTLNGSTRRIPLVLAAGTVTSHSLEFAAPPPAVVSADSAIEIRSEPSGARVSIDGSPSGTTPIVVKGLTAGRHEVRLSGPFPTVTKFVTLAPKQQQRLVVAPARSAEAEGGTERRERPARVSAETGFIAIQSPIVLRVVKNGDFVGTSEDSKLALPAGPQVIGLENESVGFRDVRTVEVVAGKITNVGVTLPKGEISINARPWAEVFVDGERIGETPVSQLSLPVGIHEIVFRHPEHGERRTSVIVKIGATGRAFADFTK
jgi:hypothetical protein